jgi:hypothetical protein
VTRDIDKFDEWPTGAQDKVEGLECDLDAALIMIRNLACGLTNQTHAAQWLALNYRKRIETDWPMRRLIDSGPPPPQLQGIKTWDDWFAADFSKPNTKERQ